MQRLSASLALALLGLLASAPSFGAQSTRPHTTPQRQQPAALDPAYRLLAPYGLDNFPPQVVRALETFVSVSAAAEAGDHLGARSALDALWADYPLGDPSWGALPTQPFGLNMGSPTCYYALRMLDHMTNWRLVNPGAGPAPRSVRLTVVVVGQSHGIEPRNVAELVAGGGVPVTHELDPRVLANGRAAIHESLALFKEYVYVMTEGRLGVVTNVLELPDVDLAVQATVSGGRWIASLLEPADVWPHVDADELAATDWWWLVYPSHVPEQYPAFTTAEFITGGMGLGPDLQSPLFLIDDRWLVRKPPHLGAGPYTALERKAYLPQWLQHEFFHHLYRIYPEFGLEVTSHQWFDPSTWPSDFVGRYEPDYYHESLVRRLRFGSPPLHVKLRYATADAPWDQLTPADVMGTYRRLPFLNGWHIGDVRSVGGNYEWLNTAGVSWSLADDIANGVLHTGPDCPYFDLPSGKRFQLVLERDAIGDLTTDLAGFAFLGEMYRRD